MYTQQTAGVHPRGCTSTRVRAIAEFSNPAKAADSDPFLILITLLIVSLQRGFPSRRGKKNGSQDYAPVSTLHGLGPASRKAWGLSRPLVVLSRGGHVWL